MKSLPNLSVVDTNVGIVANGMASHASPKCQLVCIEVLQQIVASGRIALDHLDLIFDEYRRNLSLGGYPGVGDQFMKWVHDHSYDDTRCLRVALTRLTGSPGGWDQFPTHPDLQGLDKSDRKFVAVAAGCGEAATILNATDSDWKHYRKALALVGVEVEQLCPGELKDAPRSKAS